MAFPGTANRSLWRLPLPQRAATALAGALLLAPALAIAGDGSRWAASPPPQLLPTQGSLGLTSVVQLSSGDLLHSIHPSLCGRTDPGNPCERFNWKSGRWTPTGSMPSVKRANVLISLQDGRVLSIGGQASIGISAPLPSCELYDPATGTWRSTGSLVVPRRDASATLLDDGRVLVAGGNAVGTIPDEVRTEIFDPATETWKEVAARAVDFPDPLFPLSSVVLPDGRVFLFRSGTGGIYDPTKDAWTATRLPASSYRSALYPYSVYGRIAPLPDGRILAAGGFQGPAEESSPARCEIYDPLADAWSPTGSLGRGRDPVFLTPLSDGTLLAAGGLSPHAPTQMPTFFPDCETFDPRTGAWSPTAPLTTLRVPRQVYLLPDRSVLALYGYGDLWTKVLSCERYTRPMWVDSVSPDFGSASGGEAVLIEGAGFNRKLPAAVSFGGIPAREVAVLGPTQILAVTPSYPTMSERKVDVSVSQGGFTTSRAMAFTYLPAALAIEPVLKEPDPAPIGAYAIE